MIKIRTAYFQKSDIITDQDLGAGALDYTTTLTRAFRLSEILIHFDGASTETITITKDSAKGPNYDTVKVKRSLIAETDFVYRPQGNPDYQAGDKIRVQCTNAGATHVYVTLKTSEI